MQAGSHTATVYSAIQQGRFADATGLLQAVLRLEPTNRAALSLLGYCQYQLEEFDAAAQTYGALCAAHPGVPDYRTYWCQSLFKAGQLAEAARAAAGLVGPPAAVALLSSAIRLEQGDLKGCRQVLEALGPGDPAAVINLGCLLYRERQWAAAAEQFSQAIEALGFTPQLAYSVAVCQYRQRDYPAALATISGVVELGVHEHPELGVRTVGNSAKLRATALVEAFNLRAAVELELRDPGGAAAALADMPPRQEAELDPVTLHNQALVGLARGGAAGATAGLDKLAHLLAHPPFPPEVVGNLLSLCCRPGGARPGLGEEVLASHPELVAAHLPPRLAAFYGACAARARAPHECEARLDAIAGQHVEQLRRLVKQVQDARWANDPAAAEEGLAEYEAALEAFVPVLMSLTSLHWESGAPARAQEVLQQSAEFCGDHAAWRLNLAHALVAQEGGHLPDAVELYESILQHFASGGAGAGVGGGAGEGADAGAPLAGAAPPGGGSILDVPPSALANLCVCYVIRSQNEVAEDLLRRLEDATATAQAAAAQATAEAAAAGRDPGAAAAQPTPPHLSLANLAIGTLYCSKGNFEFGITRVMRALEPLAANLGATRWAGARLCFLAMLDAAAKQMLQPRDGLVADLLAFLEDVEEAGRDIPAGGGAGGDGVQGGGGSDSMPGGAARTIRSEARAIQALLLKMCD
eukprot:scaffold13.g192.t1